MAIIKCKMCGGDMELSADKTYGTCEYCGSTMTFPKADDEQRVNLFNRANHFRRQNEFDKAVAAYERILDDNNADAEAHWGVVLSRFGIEYVEDPVTHERIPTCHRVQAASILTDADYLAALEYAPDGYSRDLYEAEAKRIAEIQKGILAISAQEKPYDVFICYKESDASGSRTKDSTIAQDIYYQLKQEGFKVFFARITLEDKLGQQYEPYIFAALNSAKVMLVVGTKPEYFNAVWVKNEWSRYLALMKQDRSRLLIPCYRDMDPYDLPEELSALQSQDMSKIGFMQDLIRGVKKVLNTGKPQQKSEQAATPTPTSAVAPLLKRAFMFLEDGDWRQANEYCEKVLDMDPENAEAYLGKLMAELKVGKREKLPDQPQPFNKSNNYAKACRFSDTLSAELKGCTEHIIRRNEEARVAGVYDRACQTKRNARCEEDFEKAIKLFQSIIKHRDSQSMIQQCHEGVMNCRYQAACQQKASASSEAAYKAASQLFANLGQYKDAAAQAAECLELAEASRKDDIYQTASYKMSNTSDQNSWEYAIRLFKSIPGWKDADAKVAECENKIAELKARRQEKERQEQLAREKAAKEAKLKKQITMIASAVAAVIVAVALLVNNVIIPNQKYDAAVELMNEGKYADAYNSFIALNGYKDSATMATVAYQQYEMSELKKASVGSYITFGTYEQDNNTSNGKEDIEWLVLAKENNRLLVISRYALDCMPYNEVWSAVTWEPCTLRKWLNNDFLNAAFSRTEKAMIPTVTVPADKNPDYSTSPGNATQDKVFLLSIPEVNKYFTSDSTRQCEPTAYAKGQGTWTNDSGFCWWWLRSPGIYQNNAAYVLTDGGVEERGSFVDRGSVAVRPAMWINLEP